MGEHDERGSKVFGLRLSTELDRRRHSRHGAWQQAGQCGGICDDILTAGAASIADIEKLMAELQTARDYLQAEGERVRRLTTRYAHLTKTASASVKIIAESLGKWRSPELESISQAHSAKSEAPAASLVHGSEPQQGA